MPDKVADASVLAAVVFQERRSEEAQALLSGAQLCEPLLLAYELTSVARKKALQQPERRGSLTEALQQGLALNVRWVEVDFPAVLELALDKGLTTYDATYLHLARTLGVPLVTFDRDLQAAAQA